MSDRTYKVVRFFVLLILLCLMGFSGLKVLSIIKGYQDAEDEYEMTSEHFVTVTAYSGVKPGQTGAASTGTATSSGGEMLSTEGADQTPVYVPEWYELARVDLAGLRKVNSDICGWILFENEDISYPILYSGDDDKYLRTTYTGKEATAGSIFMEGENTPDFMDRHTIIYGHNMRNLSMFGKLKYYRTEEGYYDEHAYFQIFTEETVYRYMIFSCFQVNAEDPLYTVYGPDADISDFVNKQMVKRSKVTSVGELPEELHVITLSTCTTGDNRFVVCAALVDEHPLTEDEE